MPLKKKKVCHFPDGPVILVRLFLCGWPGLHRLTDSPVSGLPLSSLTPHSVHPPPLCLSLFYFLPSPCLFMHLLCDARVIGHSRMARGRGQPGNSDLCVCTGAEEYPSLFSSFPPTPLLPHLHSSIPCAAHPLLSHRPLGASDIDLGFEWIRGLNTDIGLSFPP